MECNTAFLQSLVPRKSNLVWEAADACTNNVTVIMHHHNLADACCVCKAGSSDFEGLLGTIVEETTLPPGFNLSHCTATAIIGQVERSNNEHSIVQIKVS